MKKVLNIIYFLIPFKKQFCLLLRIFYIPSKRVYRKLSFRGDFFVKINDFKRFKIKNEGNFIEKELFWKGIFNGWERKSLKIWAELSEKSDVIFDVGANTGVYSLLAKTMNSKAQVFAFEPIDSIFKKMKNNVSINNFDIILIKKGISNYDGFAKIHHEDKEYTTTASLSEVSFNVENIISTEIKVVKGDTFMDINNINSLNLLKLDVENYEDEALKGFENSILKYEPSILIEILNDEMASKIQKIIANIDYQFYNINEANNSVMEVENLTKSDGFNFLICKSKVAKELSSLKS